MSKEQLNLQFETTEFEGLWKSSSNSTQGLAHPTGTGRIHSNHLWSWEAVRMRDPKKWEFNVRCRHCNEAHLLIFTSRHKNGNLPRKTVNILDWIYRMIPGFNKECNKGPIND